MIDDTPYIIVDNRKIAPIERSPRPDSATADRPGREEQPFGVVDRVSISSEARERSKRPLPDAESDPPALDNHSKQSPDTGPLLTYSPKRLQ